MEWRDEDGIKKELRNRSQWIAECNGNEAEWNHFTRELILSFLMQKLQTREANTRRNRRMD
jgi:hypothetical protein